VQALCSQCSQKIVIDDAKVPDRPFNVKCPKCQTVVKLPGKMPASVPASPAVSPAEPAFRHAAGEADGEEGRGSLLALTRREAGGETAAPGERALVAVTEPAHAAAIGPVLSRLGYLLDSLDHAEDGVRMLEQGIYAVAVTSRAFAAQGGPETLYQRITRLNPEARRRVFVILVGDEFKSADGLQAFVALSDLVLHSRDAPNCESAIRNAILERRRAYQAFHDARKRFEVSPG
jgi:hypothetical protein